jgi:hypothetical protein
MACIALSAHPSAMATTQLARIISCEVRYEASAPRCAEHNAEHAHLRMNWVVVVGENGRPQLRTNWLIADDAWHKW